MHGYGLGTDTVLVFVIEPDLFARNVDDERVSDCEAFDHHALDCSGKLGDFGNVAADRVFGHGVCDLIGADLLSGTLTVFGQILKGVMPVAVIIRTDLYSLLQCAVGIQFDHYDAGTGIAGVLVVFPDFLDGNVNIRRNVSVNDFNIAVFVFDVFGIVSVNDVFFERVYDLVAACVILGKILKAPLPVVISGHDDAVDLSGALHQVDGYGYRAYFAFVIIVVPCLEAVLVYNGRFICKGNGCVLILFDRFCAGGECDVRNRIVPFASSDGLIGLNNVACNKCAAGLGHGVCRAFGQIGECRGLAADERELDEAGAARQTDELILIVAYTIIICSVWSQFSEYDIEGEFGTVVFGSALKHLCDLEPSLGRIDLRVSDNRGNNRRGSARGSPCSLTGLVSVADLEFFDGSLLNFVVQIGIGYVGPGSGCYSRKSGNIDGLTAFDHKCRAYAVLKVNISEQAGNIRCHLSECAVSVQCHCNRELACKIFFGERCPRSGFQFFLDLQFRRRRIDLVIGYCHGRGGAGYVKRTASVLDRLVMTERIGFGYLVRDADGQIGQSDLLSSLEKDIRHAVLQRHVTVSAVERGIAEHDVYCEFSVPVSVISDYFLNRKARGLRSGLGVCDLDGIFAVSKSNQSLVRIVVRGRGFYCSAGLVFDRNGVVNASIGFPIGHGTLPEVVRGINIIDVECVAPGSVAVVDPLVDIAYLTYKSGVCRVSGLSFAIARPGRRVKC